MLIMMMVVLLNITITIITTIITIGLKGKYYGSSKSKCIIIHNLCKIK